MIDVALRASEEVVDAYDVRTIRKQPLTEMRTQEASTPGNQYARLKMHVHAIPLKLRNYSRCYDCVTCQNRRQFPTSKIGAIKTSAKLLKQTFRLIMPKIEDPRWLQRLFEAMQLKMLGDKRRLTSSLTGVCRAPSYRDQRPR